MIVSILQFLILKLMTTIDTNMFTYFLQQLPESIRAMFGEEFVSRQSVEGIAAFGFNHPLVLVMLSIGAILIPSRHIAGEAETGTLELILSLPVKRVQLIFNLCLSVFLFLFLIVVCGLGASLLSISIFHQLSLTISVKMLKISCNLLLLFILIMSMTMMLSTFEKEGNKVSIRAAGITLVFYLLHYLSPLWDAIKFTQPYNIFTYYQPGNLITGQRSFLQHVIVLSSLILICLCVSFYQFNRRDIPG
jgi:ABC-type transport system involved in multi-copper enzyme maturation permease subunit